MKNKSVPFPLRIAAVQNFAFGGVNTSLIIKRWQDN